MASKILVPVDGSDNSFRALERALSISKNTGAAVTALQVMESPPTVYVESQKLLNEIKEKYKQEAAKILDKCKALAEKSGAKIETVMAEGDPAATIIGYIEQGGFDTIVIGSRGHGKLKEMVLGSVSSKVLHHAKAAVMIVK